MTTSVRRLSGTTRVLALVLLFLASSTGAAFAQDVAISSVKTWLTNGKVAFHEAGREAVEFKTGFSDKKTYTVFARADAANHYLYLAVVDLAKLDAKDAAFAEKAKKLMRLNYGLMLAKVEWDEDSGEIRVSQSYSTEGGFDEKAFFQALQNLLSAAEAAEPKLKAL